MTRIHWQYKTETRMCPKTGPNLLQKGATNLLQIRPKRGLDLAQTELIPSHKVGPSQALIWAQTGPLEAQFGSPSGGLRPQIL